MKQFRVAMLGYGIAGKAFARILNQTHDDILAKTGFDVKVVAIRTVNVHRKPKRLQRYEGFKAAYKKAIVRLADGQSIDVFEI